MKLQILYIFFIAPIFIKAQEFLVTGKVIDENNTPLDFAEVYFYNQNSSLIKSDFTDPQGKISAELLQGIYKLQIKQLDEILYSKDIHLTESIDLGVIQIKSAKEIEGVIVEGKKKLIERKIDRLVFNVENSISASGGDALDALRVTPGIRVKEDAISIIGKSDMKVMVDERIILLSGEDLINYLKSIASEDIQSIEVITTPPAKYSAEGNSGLLNIKLKKARKDSWKATLRGTYTQATYPSENLYGSFSFQKKKWSLLTGLSVLNSRYIHNNDQSYHYPTGEYWDIKNSDKPKRSGINPNFALGYKLNDKLTLGIQYEGSFYNEKVNENSQTYIYTNNSTKELNKYFNSQGKSKQDYAFHSGNLNALYKIDSLGKEMSLNINYFNKDNQKNNPFYTTNIDYITSIEDHFYTTNISEQKLENYSVTLDFEMPYKWARLNYGGKLSTTNNNNYLEGNFYRIINKENQLYLSQRENFNYKENNQALYFSIHKEFNDQWEFKAGLRMEATQTKGHSELENQEDKKDYIKLFPSAYLSYKINPYHSLVLDYSRRIEKPSYWMLNPARWYTNLYSVEFGNPALQPSFTHNINLSYIYRDILNSTFAFSKTENGFGQLIIHDNERNTYFIRDNYFKTNNISLGETITLKPLNFWDLSSTSAIWYAETHISVTNYLKPYYSGWGGYSDINNTLSINKKFSIQLNYSYNYPQLSRESIVSASSELNIGFRYTMLNNKLNFNVLFNNILGSDRMTLKQRLQDNTEQSFKQYYDTQYIRFSLSYSFGNNKLNINKKEVGNEEEKKRM